MGSSCGKDFVEISIRKLQKLMFQVSQNHQHFSRSQLKKINFCAESVTDNVINLDKSSSYMIMSTGILSSIIEDFLFAQTVRTSCV